jgi:hypothetical protein
MRLCPSMTISKAFIVIVFVLVVRLFRLVLPASGDEAAEVSPMVYSIEYSSSSSSFWWSGSFGSCCLLVATRQPKSPPWFTVSSISCVSRRKNDYLPNFTDWLPSSFGRNVHSGIHRIHPYTCSDASLLDGTRYDLTI